MTATYLIAFPMLAVAIALGHSLPSSYLDPKAYQWPQTRFIDHFSSVPASQWKHFSDIIGWQLRNTGLEMKRDIQFTPEHSASAFNHNSNNDKHLMQYFQTSKRCEKGARCNWKDMW
ncbi:uncharacterized protein LOC142334595 [Convolutriloba macropyga]|uniref:uncharacterized protein LOC142334595 n=1 Tax=Convolutriloba macropyga TaxID=536237 RepID=UPI003F51FB93